MANTPNLERVVDATTTGRGGGLTEDSREPNDEGSVRVAHNLETFATLVAGYEIDPITRDPAVDTCVFMLLVVVEPVALDVNEP